MKWYLWLAIAIALGLIIWFATKKKSSNSISANALGTSPANNSFLASGFNPYQLTQIA